MQAIMLAAGMGRRLGPYTTHNTKCMLEVAGKTLLIRAVEALKNAGIHRFILVTGYMSENLRTYAAENIQDMEVVYVHNADYETTNNIYSLYLAKEWLALDDTILLESDIIFEPRLITEMVENEYNDLAAVARHEPWMEGTVTLIDSNNRIVEFIDKNDLVLSAVREYFKTVNVYKFSQQFSTAYYIPMLESYIQNHGKNEYYEVVLKAITHLEGSNLKAFRVKDLKWYEIDEPKDLDDAVGLFTEDHNRYDFYRQRFGGYWRYPTLIDFSLLANPYFPPVAMLDQMQQCLRQLVTQYPSNLQIQNIHAARLFHVNAAFLTVGNGASELIQAVGELISGRIAVMVPTFNEYLRCFSQGRLLKLHTAANGNRLDKALLLSSLDCADVLIIVNPDNPGGSFLDFDDLMEVINQAHRTGKMLIIDESFIDFVDQERRYSLMDSEILDRHPHLIVIRSLGKSYGIPGLRLGILACGNRDLLQAIKQRLPIWNINALAEYFLQIMPLFQKEYLAACQQMADQRKSFTEKLSRLDFLSVYNSQTNYLLCRLHSPYSSTSIAEHCLLNHGILITDLCGKEGFEDGQHIRLAVRSETENNALITAFRAFAE